MRLTLRKLEAFALLGSFLTLFSCGIELGGGSLNDPVPNGTLVAHGTFSGVSGNEVTGGASLYRGSNGFYIIRLESLTAPAEPGLSVVGERSSGGNCVHALRGSTGNQNYYTECSGSLAAWTAISIRTNSAAEGLNVYGRAFLTLRD